MDWFLANASTAQPLIALTGEALTSSTPAPFSDIQLINNRHQQQLPSDNKSIDNASRWLIELGDELYTFKESYRLWHGYLSLIICAFGLVTNVLNIIVLTRKDMISATNAILTGMAIADLLVIGSYIPFAIHNYLPTIVDQSPAAQFTFGWALFTLFHAHFTVVCHTISIWLTVLLAIWRYLTVSSPTAGKVWCSLSRAKWAIVMTYLLVPVICMPAYLTFTINQFNIDGLNQQLYKVDFKRYSPQMNEILQKMNFGVIAIFSKVFPCILLTYLSIALIRVLVEAKNRRMRLKMMNDTLWHQASFRRSSPSGTGVGNNNRRQSSIKIKNKLDAEVQNGDRTTKMLIAVLITFIICELPSGTLSILSGIFGELFFTHVYVNLGELMDVLALASCAINFVLYCTMSRQFRKTFKRLFWSDDVTEFICERRKSLQSIIHQQSAAFTEQTGV